ncbi:helix-turn-helix domain-containing protein [Saccharothrix coeruleofusca]|uniref:Transcriptional regulator n=1 Tax=Saccharothrix coeruleofusca TaxID=33919 RepID=A0A918ATM8_9PSEU|nr:helix-turn-helix transcriptional regulator [Saccharothrix coeruleofusca]GGP73129.1 transcriptional regulator [Saccharothrix coeruleofusca]
MNPTVRAEELGAELRALRKANGLSLEEAGERISASAAKVSRIETGKCGGSSEDVAALLAVYRCVGSKRAELLDLARGVDRLGWWQRAKPDFAHRQRTLINLEARADLIVSFEGMNVPGLLQTGEYTRALMTECGMVPLAEIEGRMVTRMQRHAVLLKPDAPQLIAFINELVLHQVIGGIDVLRRQLGHLLEAARKPNITLRVLPNVGTHPGVNGGFELVRRTSGHKVVFLENLTSSLFLEEPSEIKTYETAIRVLGERALSSQESMLAIAEVARKLEVDAG